MQTQLIMLEGVSFTGKSTLSEFAAEQLNLNGSPAQWISEGMMLQRYFPHVLAVLEQKQSISEALLAADWSAFVQAAMTSPTIFVVDAALSFAAVGPLLMADRPPAAILAELKRIADVCAPLQPRVIHLTGDIGTLAPASIAERGEGWQAHLVRQSDASPYQQARGRSGVAGAIEFMQEWQSFMRVVLEDSGWQTLTLDVTDTDWNTNQRTMLSLLGIAGVTVDRPMPASADLQAYTGTYAAEVPEEAGDTLSVRLEQDTLALHGRRMRFGTLVPVSATRFHVRATRLDLEFVVEDGVASRLMLFTPDGAAGVYLRTEPHHS